MGSKELFFKKLEKYPRIANLWNKQSGSLEAEAFEKALTVMSSGEVQMAKFFAAIWFNDNQRYGFDLIDAVSRVDIEDRCLIISWIDRPFWP